MHRSVKIKSILAGGVLALAIPMVGSADVAPVDVAAKAVEPHVIEWRRHLHANPELSNREVKTADFIAKRLKAMGLEVKTGIAHTGVAALLKGGKPGKTIALRADMDALPVTEQNDLPFRSKVTTEFRGEKVGVMHACGHDGHVAILLGVAEALVKMKDSLSGQVLFVFQPAEEGPPEGERGGAKLMMEEGLFNIAKPDAMIGLHLMASLNTGVIGYKPGPLMAGSDYFTIVVTGAQTHGSRPWGGVDPITVSGQIITGLQTIVSRQIDITQVPAVITVGAIKGGIRFNIIPDSVEMVGTVRNFDRAMRDDIVKRMQTTASNIAEASGAKAEVKFRSDVSLPPVVNDLELTDRAVPLFEQLVGKDNVTQITLQTTADDFSFFGTEVPSIYFWVGITPRDKDPAKVPFNHSPLFYLDEAGLITGVRAMLALTTDFLAR
ncbi:N-acyl-L-amino acid amidohydrolase [Steroidobacter agaridevorans]|uniref:N-acyl-L-amino acid amidohydrolase n=1 Tax=Steroidobacter agaridevorans TaxID=2695856 RepID=A0A829Y7J4_9GAMM|nr:amidohydrolase [Steroidobacter agaridevorans]GFE78766.1 N-acyl-L-amino acid amidohydrolase [Steroidobacter agaridevorans]